MTWSRSLASGVLAAFLVFGGLPVASGQAFAQEPAQGANAAELTDRFSDRVAQALHLDESRAEQLRLALQRSRELRQALAAQRRSLFRELAEVARGDGADQERVAQLLDDVLRTQVQEAEINVDEQRRLSEFMAPLERARFLWLRQRFLQQARQRGQDLRRNNQIPRDRRPPDAAEQRVVPERTPSRP
ncbi:MAG: hypothetical protein P8Y11_10865 [Gemmatimonadales bacterium]